MEVQKQRQALANIFIEIGSLFFLIQETFRLQPIFMDICKIVTCKNFEFMNASCEKCASKKSLLSYEEKLSWAWGMCALS